jgi:hypothetical protein
MEKLIELLQQIQELANVAIEALQGASESAGAAPEGGAPEGGGEAVPTRPEGAPEEE